MNISKIFSKENIYIGLFILVVIGVAIFLYNRYGKNTEGLSLSQFPVPTCSTNNGVNFYTCGKCGTIYQEQNMVGQPCDCGGFVAYDTFKRGSCYKPTLKNLGDITVTVGPPDSVTEPFRDNYVQNVPLVSGSKGLCPFLVSGSKSSCTSCNKDKYMCLQAAGTFDSGSTWLRNLPCPVVFPPVVPGYTPTVHKQMRHVSEKNVHDHLNKGDLIIAANDGSVIEYTMQKLIETTLAGGSQGYPNFYYIEGPVLAMTKVGDTYYWLYGYPVTFTPENYSNYVNRSNNWNIAKTAYKRAIQLLNQNAPVIFFTADQDAKEFVAATAKCMPKGIPQSSTDFYYPGCTSKSCLWGPEFGSGNWLTRV